MDVTENFGLYVMSGFYILAGIMHFIKPKFFISIVPPYITNRKGVVYLSGLIEIALGIGLLFDNRRSFSATGLILLLIAVFPANVYMATSPKFSKIPAWIRWGRLPLQLVLIAWALQYV